jgi:hypothetical protein
MPAPLLQSMGITDAALCFVVNVSVIDPGLKTRKIVKERMDGQSGDNLPDF